MTHNKRILTGLAFAGALFIGAQAQAQQVAVPVGAQGERADVQLPANGMSQDSVRNRWGAPQSMEGPVGQPPISQWHYDRFVVYFENNRVLHAVMKRNP
ncbi:MAG: hypothetical protein VX939_07400 [Pseudomonadota bacterium]|nr:hypothetical protein [Pseudomonadota bacterium]